MAQRGRRVLRKADPAAGQKKAARLRGGLVRPFSLVASEKHLQCGSRPGSRALISVKIKQAVRAKTGNGQIGTPGFGFPAKSGPRRVPATSPQRGGGSRAAKGSNGG